MNRRINVRLAAALLPLLFAAAVLGIAYATHSPGGVDRSAALTSHPPAGSAISHADAQSPITGIQECRAGPSKCTGQPGLASAPAPGDSLWSLAAPSLAHELFTPRDQLASQVTAYRLTPPPRVA